MAPYNNDELTGQPLHVTSLLNPKDKKEPLREQSSLTEIFRRDSNSNNIPLRISRNGSNEII